MVLGEQSPLPAGDTLQPPVADSLRTAVVGDILDQLGRVHQFLPPEVSPISSEMRLVGRAMPVLTADVFSEQNRAFGRMTEALDQLQVGEIYLVRAGRTACASWGEILTATARKRGAVGAVIDGYHRDTRQILAQDWPVFSRGAYGQDARVRASVIDYRVPIQVGAVTVRPGDLVIGDCDGVVVVPADIEDEVLQAATEKSRAENLVRAAIEGGMSSAQAFQDYGVL